MNPNTDQKPEKSEIFSGGPGPATMGGAEGVTEDLTSDGTGEGGSAAVEPAAKLPAAQQPSPVVVGDRVFNSTEEALAYANLIARAQATPSPAPPQKRIRPSEILFEEPESAFTLLKEEIKQEVKGEMAIADVRAKTWSGFYKDYPDLAGNEDIVELCQSQLSSDIRDKLPISQSLPILAKQARDRISKIRGSSSNAGTQLPSKPAVTAGSSGASPPPVQMPQAQPMNFIQELQASRMKR